MSTYPLKTELEESSSVNQCPTPRKSIPLKAQYEVNWIRPHHAEQVARLEALVHPSGYRAGRYYIRMQLAEAEIEGRNLSAGIFYGRRLVAYCLRYLERDRRKICSYLDVDEPAGLDLEGPGIYLADLVTDPQHRKGVGMHLPRMVTAGDERPELRGMTIEAFCTRPLLSIWERHAQSLSRIGLQMILKKEFHDPILNESLYWLRYARSSQLTFNSTRRRFAKSLKNVQTVNTREGPVEVGLMDTAVAWDLLEPHWDELLAVTPGATVFSSHAFLKTWWQQLLIRRNILMIVVLAENNVVRAIAPMQIAHKRWMGRWQRCLGFIGNASEVDRPVLLATEEDQPLLAPIIADYLMAHRQQWDAVVLAEQQPESPLLKAMAKRLKTAGFFITLHPGGTCNIVDVSGSWSDYLASRSRSQRKSVKRHLKRLRGAGRMTVDVIDSSQGPDEAFDRFLQLEERSWKSAAGLGFARSSAHLAFYRALVNYFAAGNAAHFRFLTLDGKDIAATFGLRWRGTLYSLSIVHDEDYRDYSPGFVLTALELEEGCNRADYSHVDYLGGFVSNKRGWATNTLSTSWLYAHPRNLNGLGYHGYHFHISPWIKNQLRRFNLLQPVLRIKQSLMISCARFK